MGWVCRVCFKRKQIDMIAGFILVMVTILPNGDINSTAINYFQDGLDCRDEIRYQLENAPARTNFVCIPDHIL